LEAILNFPEVVSVHKLLSANGNKKKKKKKRLVKVIQDYNYLHRECHFSQYFQYHQKQTFLHIGTSDFQRHIGENNSEQQ